MWTQNAALACASTTGTTGAPAAPALGMSLSAPAPDDQDWALLIKRHSD
jgi:hypothetical protein